jgi:guanylate kinase
MANARAEVQCYGEYDFVIVNDDIEKAIKAFEDIIFTKNYDSNKNLIEKILQDMLSY